MWRTPRDGFFSVTNIAMKHPPFLATERSKVIFLSMVKIVILKSRRELHRKVFTISEEETTGWTCLRRRKIIWFILLFWKFPFNHFKMFMCIKLHSDVWRNQEIWSLYLTWFMLWSDQLVCSNLRICLYLLFTYYFDLQCKVDWGLT